LGPDTKQGNEKDDPPSVAQVYCRFNNETLPDFTLPLCLDLTDAYCVNKQGNPGNPFEKNGCEDLAIDDVDGPGCDGDKVECCDPNKLNPVVPNNCDPNFGKTSTTTTAP
jgi:hypothetical protein